MKTTFITTVFNEESTIIEFTHSLLAQTKLPDEVIIVDGGSKDRTVLILKRIISNIKNKRLKKSLFKVVVKKGNRSVGRNEAIKQATGNIIICSDAGNVLDKNWVRNITKQFLSNYKSVDVVAGYYEGKGDTVFQKCVTPYALVMPDNVKPTDFLPATRSIAFKKSIWEKVGKFDESLSHNEDYVFARKLKESGAKIAFAKDAIVYWQPRKNLKQTFIMLWRFAFGDAEAGIIRTKVLLVFARYFFGLYFIFLCLFYRSVTGLIISIFLLVLYIFWSIQKNYKYVRHKKAFLILPVLQFTADAAVISGTGLGLLKHLRKFSITKLLINNKLLLGVLIAYSLIELFTLHWGIPNQNHPFPYHMDEWHQLQAVGNTFRYGTPNTAGSANGTMFHFLVSGLYLIPFIILKIVNPFTLEITNTFMRERIFEVLRMQTILFGLLSIFVFYKVAELIKVSKVLAITLFTFTPIWLMLSGYFKYDIAMIFWVLLSLYFIFRFGNNPTNKNYLIAAIPASLAIAVKISAAPLLLLYTVAYFWFKKDWKKNLKVFITGIILFITIILFFGMPDMLFGKGNIIDYFYGNVFVTPADTGNIQLGIHPLIYLIISQYQILFGKGLYVIFVISCLFLLTELIKKGIIKFIRVNKIAAFLIFSLAVMFASLVPLQIYGGGNRTLILLPYIVLIVCLVWQRIMIYNTLKYIGVALLFIVIGMQFYESFSWVYMRTVPSPQARASEWLQNNIEHNTTIGIENIPIYQNLPDLIQKEFYLEDFKIKNDNVFNYNVIDLKARSLPDTIIITNGEFEANYYKLSPKKSLVERIRKEGYQKKAEFIPDFTFYKIFGNEKDYYFSWLLSAPLTTTVYTK